VHSKTKKKPHPWDTTVPEIQINLVLVNETAEVASKTSKFVAKTAFLDKHFGFSM